MEDIETILFLLAGVSVIVVIALLFFTKYKKEERVTLAQIKQKHKEAINLAIHGNPDQSEERIIKAVNMLKKTAREAKKHHKEVIWNDIEDTLRDSVELLQLFCTLRDRYIASKEKRKLATREDKLKEKLGKKLKKLK